MQYRVTNMNTQHSERHVSNETHVAHFQTKMFRKSFMWQEKAHAVLHLHTRKILSDALKRFWTVD